MFQFISNQQLNSSTFCFIEHLNILNLVIPMFGELPLGQKQIFAKSLSWYKVYKMYTKYIVSQCSTRVIQIIAKQVGVKQIFANYLCIHCVQIVSLDTQCIKYCTTRNINHHQKKIKHHFKKEKRSRQKMIKNNFEN